MRDDRAAGEGYLLLADISGYTAFLTGTELEHAHAIVHELTGLIRERLTPPMRFVKLEGDAVFCYAETGTFRDAERLIELIETCYFDFSNRLDDMTRATTCRCAACAAIGTLGLKFVAHHGTFLVDREGNREDLAGPDVILVHRLLKNRVSDDGGPAAYALLTDACLEHLPAPFVLSRHREVYESFGETTGGVHDLEPVLRSMRAERHVQVTDDDADFEASVDLPVPPAVAWQYFVDPLERQRWACRHFSKEPDALTPNSLGRMGSGTVTHCNHAPGTWMREFIDWRPYEYFTARTTAPRLGRFIGPRSETETVELVPIDDGGTRVTTRARITNRGRMSLLSFRLQRRVYAAFFRHIHAALREVAQEDAADRQSTEAHHR